MKYLLSTFAFVSFLSTSHVFAGLKEDLEAELKDTPKAYNIAMKAINNIYAFVEEEGPVDWSQFNFKDAQDQKTAELLFHALTKYLDALTGEKYEIKAALSKAGKRNDADYQRACDEHKFIFTLNEGLGQTYSLAALEAMK